MKSPINDPLVLFIYCIVNSTLAMIYSKYASVDVALMNSGMCKTHFRALRAFSMESVRFFSEGL